MLITEKHVIRRCYELAVNLAIKKKKETDIKKTERERGCLCVKERERESL